MEPAAQLVYHARVKKALGICLALLLAGCGPKEEVRRYKAPKEPTWRILGALAKSGDDTWFLKATGPAEHLGSYREEVLGFLRGVKVEGGDLRWSLPKGWEEGKSKSDRVATLVFGARLPKQELAISRLGGDAGGLGPNINRWRGQLGLAPATDAELGALIQKVAASGIELSFVDLEGPNRPVAPQARRGHGDAHPEPPPRARRDPREMFTFTLPQGWRELANPGPPRILEIAADAGVKVSLSGMPGDGGGLGPNINRWRDQAGLEPLGDEEAKAQAKPFRFLESPGWIVEMAGPDKTIVVAVVVDHRLSLFLKMEGAPGAVASQRAPFEALAGSMRAEGLND